MLTTTKTSQKAVLEAKLAGMLTVSRTCGSSGSWCGRPPAAAHPHPARRASSRPLPAAPAPQSSSTKSPSRPGSRRRHRRCRGRGRGIGCRAMCRGCWWLFVFGMISWHFMHWRIFSTYGEIRSYGRERQVLLFFLLWNHQIGVGRPKVLHSAH